MTEIAPTPGRVLADELDRTPAIQASPSARSLLLSALGTFVLPSGGAAWTTSLVRVLGLLDVEDRTARQALTRAGQSGWLSSERHGRRARWSLTSRSAEILTSGAERIYSFGLAPDAWDGRWLLMFASVPETQRDARYRLRTALNWAGFGSLTAGVWITPAVEREADALGALAELDVDIDAKTFVAEQGRVGDSATLVADAWDLTSLAAEYRAFADRHTPPATDISDEDAAKRLLRATHEWRRFPSIDPGLPAELLPPAWPGTPVARQFAELRHALLPSAERYWNDLEGA